MSQQEDLRSQRLTPEQLRWSCDPRLFTFQTTAELKADEIIVGQDRAVRALELGLTMSQPSYHVYVTGPVGTGRTTYTRKKVQAVAATMPVPPDWCYVYNFQQPDQPLAVSLPPGAGAVFRKEMAELVAELKDAIRKLLSSETFESQRTQLLQSFENRINAVWRELEARAMQLGFTIQRTPTGITTVPVGPSGEQISPDQFGAMTELQRDEVGRRGRELSEDVAEALRKVRTVEREARDALRELERSAVSSAAGHPVGRVREQNAGHPKVAHYLDELLADVVEHHEDFKEQEEPQFPLPLPQMARRADPFQRYRVNLVVDNTHLTGAPMVFETNPTYYNLLGKVEYRGEFGALVTDFTMIKSGALQQASGGFLVLQVKDILTNPLSWEGLKRALRSGEARIENIGEQLGLIPTATLRPEPIPLSVKVVLIGTPMIFQLLYVLDEDFRKLFKIKADFDTEVNRTDDTAALYARAIGAICNRQGLRPFDRAAVAKVLEYSARLAEHQERLSTRFNEVVEIIYEASAWAERMGHEIVAAADVLKAIDEKVYRSNRIEARIRQMIAERQLLVDVDGRRPGQVNGLSVLQMGDYAFGHPSRITARAYVGGRGVVNIERETEMSGRIHSKGVAILAHYLGGKYAQDRPLSLNASLTFEQTYTEVEGDSASSTELYALLSELAGAPVEQGIAVTGSVNQKGEIQPIGGVNEKIEGYFAVCKALGLTGRQGVMIPAQNAINLMLKEEVVNAARAGTFHIWAVRTVDEGLEVLTGLPSGEAGANGQYPGGTINHRVSRRLQELAERLRRFAPIPRVGEGKNEDKDK
ncbi:MAG: AAA family ATPase [Armatimonadetes bacterium]|nr:AAA family ATPase [Armatimonadota bacterium]